MKYCIPSLSILIIPFILHANNDTLSSKDTNQTVINGHTLPPEPDPIINNSTLLGIDSNNNGVRDDVERWIYNRYKDDHPIMIPLRLQASRAYRIIIQDPSKARETYHIMDNQMNCEWVFTSLTANYFGRKPLVLRESETSISEDKELEYIQYNTIQHKEQEHMGSIIRY